jgi:hypothetical protein
MIPQSVKERIENEAQEYARTYNGTKLIKRPYIAGAEREASLSAGLVKALQEIAAMKREPGETTDTYAFNRCWHIATEALKQYSSK